MELPKNYDPKTEEPRWEKFWEDNKTYAFDPNSKAEIYSIDTPPPTVSGKMHLGHAFSYTQEDFIARFQRMIGKNVFYPFGTDDNGLPTQRLVEKEKKVRSVDMSRDKFVNLCLETLKDIRPKFIRDWKRIGMSCDFSVFYSTIDEHCRRISQKSFIDLYKTGREYRIEAPAIFCPNCRTAISQVECEDKEFSSHFNDIVFMVGDQELIIATTRPELLSSCVAIFYHPDDKRYQKLKGKKAKVPLFDYEVPILPDKRADPEKGTGIVMCCTFGDMTDMEWQKAHKLPIRMSIGLDGKMTEIAGKFKGMSIKEARKQIIGDLKDNNLLKSQKEISHDVNVHERCGVEVEFVHSKQWFIKYLDLKDEMLKWGSKLNWYPKHMKHRYDNWVRGLQWDWCISRQIHFGIPFPVWYCKECDEVILADEKKLPVYPLVDKPSITKCPKCGCKEFIPEKDVLNTWATSSLTPILAADLFKGQPVHEKLFPMDLRPQAHDIITFWLFNTVVKSQLHYKKNPWKDVVISGHSLDPHGRKMSKSKGNTIHPQELIEKYSADALRFWAAGSKLGEDLPFQEKDLVTGIKFSTKLWNASKFVVMHLKDFKAGKKPKLEMIDKWIISKLNHIIKHATDSFNKHEYSRTKAEVENFFWHDLCDNYLEISKDRLYNPDVHGKEARYASQYTLYHVLLGCIKMMAPIMPYITEAVYHLYFYKAEGKKSVHNSSWPVYDKKLVDDKAEKAGELAVEIISAVRKHKSSNALSLKTEVKKLTIECKKEDAASIKLVESAIKGTTKAAIIEFGKADIHVAEGLKVKIEL